jgi:hypothetical protein
MNSLQSLGVWRESFLKASTCLAIIPFDNARDRGLLKDLSPFLWDLEFFSTSMMVE